MPIISWCLEHIHFTLTIATIVTIYIWLLQCREILKINWISAFVLACIHTVFGILCMHILALAEAGFVAGNSANLRLYGAIFVLPIAYLCWAKFTKREMSIVLDVATISTLIGMIYARGTCFVEGCCVGELIWETGSVLLPIREIEVVFYIGFIAWYAGRILKGSTFGQMYPMYMLYYGVLRFVLEWTRTEFTASIGLLHQAHIWSIISILIGATICIELSNQLERKTKRRTQK